MKSFDLLMAKYKKQRHERLGQFFMNRYLGGMEWPELYDTEDEERAAHLIKQWLTEHCHEHALPVNNWLLNEKL